MKCVIVDCEVSRPDLAKGSSKRGEYYSPSTTVKKDAESDRTDQKDGRNQHKEKKQSTCNTSLHTLLLQQKLYNVITSLKVPDP